VPNLNLSFVQNTIEDFLGNIETFEMDKYYKLFPDKWLKRSTKFFYFSVNSNNTLLYLYKKKILQNAYFKADLF
jgi:hypothetical protein